MFDRNGVVILGVVYRDEAHTKPLPGVIGPFDSNADAESYMDSLGPLWGAWNTCPFYSPASPDSGEGDR